MGSGPVCEVATVADTAGDLDGSEGGGGGNPGRGHGTSPGGDQDSFSGTRGGHGQVSGQC